MRRSRNRRTSLGLPEHQHVALIGKHARAARESLKTAQNDLANGRCDNALGDWGIANLHLGNAQGHLQGTAGMTEYDREMSKLEGDLVSFQHHFADRCGIRLGRQPGLARRRRR